MISTKEITGTNIFKYIFYAIASDNQWRHYLSTYTYLLNKENGPLSEGNGDLDGDEFIRKKLFLDKNFVLIFTKLFLQLEEEDEFDLASSPFEQFCCCNDEQQAFAKCEKILLDVAPWSTTTRPTAVLGISNIFPFFCQYWFSTPTTLNLTDEWCKPIPVRFLQSPPFYPISERLDEPSECAKVAEMK